MSQKCEGVKEVPTAEERAGGPWTSTRMIERDMHLIDRVKHSNKAQHKVAQGLCMSENVCTACLILHKITRWRCFIVALTQGEDVFELSTSSPSSKKDQKAGMRT